MKKTLIFMIVAALTMGLTSCKKDNNNGSDLRFTATMEGFAKTSLNLDNNGTGILTWDESDEIAVNGTMGTAIFRVAPNSSNARIATFAYNGGEGPGQAPYKAFYPADITEDGVTVKLPTEQVSHNGELTGYPMYTESNNTNLAFKNLCSVLKLSLQKSGKNVSKIQIITDKLTTGTFDVALEDGIPTLTASETIKDHTAIITMTFDNANHYVSIDQAHNFFIYLPYGTYNYMQIKVYDENGLMFYKTSRTSTAFNRSEYNYLSFSGTAIDFTQGNVNGKFHVAANKVVTFANGNLLYRNYTSVGTQFKFAEEQFDKVDANDGNGAWTYLFNWNGSNNNTTFRELGNRNILNGGGANQGWYTLSSDEWAYVCSDVNDNNTGRGNFTTYHARASVQIQKNSSTNIGGLIIFPDVFYWPLDASKEPQFFEGATSADWGGEANAITYAEWKVLEDAGCVFLPKTGYLNTSNSLNESGNGYYWSSTHHSTTSSDSYAGCLIIQPRNCTDPGNQPMNVSYKMAFRLAKEVQ